MTAEDNYIISEAAEADIDALMEHLKRAAAETDYLIQYADELVTCAETQISLTLDHIRDPKTLFLTVKDSERIVGFITLTRAFPFERGAHRGYFGISLEKAYWNRGIGTRLINECFDYARNNGIEAIELEVHAVNERAIGVYKKNGFVELFRDSRALKNRDGSYYELVRMRRETDANKKLESKRTSI